MKTAIAFIVFNRPDLTAIVFERIASARPERLLIIADGPRNQAESAACIEARKIATSVDWPCEVLTNFSDVNMGCRLRVSSGIDWVFQQVEEAIILEDDCVPDPSFFKFCSTLLNLYRDDTRVMAISGDQFVEEAAAMESSYYFSENNHIWGWATWRRAWSCYDVDMKTWPFVRNQPGFAPNRKDPVIREQFLSTFDRQYKQEVDTWDYQWRYACLLNSGLSIHPTLNLVSNIGFRSDATHTTEISRFANLSSHSIDFPLKHPVGVFPSVQIDDALVRMTLPLTIRDRAIRKLKRMTGLP